MIGERELVLGFRMTGVEGKAVSNKIEALEAFNYVTGQSEKVSLGASERPKVLIITEDVADMLSKEILDWQMKAASPLIVEIPGLNGHVKGRKTLTDSIREAVGISV